MKWAILAVVFGVIVTWLLRVVNRHRQLRRRTDALERARSQFFRRREWLEAEFHQTAGSLGKPRGLEWADCEFEDQVAFARDRRTDQLTALVGVTIRFRAIEGGGMEDVEAVDNLKDATALFLYDGQQWSTEGRAIFNLNPAEAIDFYRRDLEPVQ